jgi:hypothetical protein
MGDLIVGSNPTPRAAESLASSRNAVSESVSAVSSCLTGDGRRSRVGAYSREDPLRGCASGQRRPSAGLIMLARFVASCIADTDQLSAVAEVMLIGEASADMATRLVAWSW